MVAGVVTCATCCMAFSRNVGTVLLLPVFVWFRGFGMYYFRQFGNDYDVWAGVIEPPPAQLETFPKRPRFRPPHDCGKPNQEWTPRPQRFA